MTHLWPGLSQLWAYGSWPGLALALVFAGILNGLMFVSFGWSELIDPGLRNITWGGFGISRVIAAFWSARRCRRIMAAEMLDPKEDPFGKAIDHYLQGDYPQTEQILESLLRRNARDLEARLMLATLCGAWIGPRKRFDNLSMLERLEGAGRWELEMQQERELLAEATTRTSSAA